MNTTPMTATESIDGMKNTERKKSRPRIFFVRMKASTSASGISTSSLPMANTKVFPTDSQYFEDVLENTRIKFLRPTNLTVPNPL